MNKKKVETQEDLVNHCLKLLFPSGQKTFSYEKIKHSLYKLNNIDLYSIRERLIEICKT